MVPHLPEGPRPRPRHTPTLARQVPAPHRLTDRPDRPTGPNPLRPGPLADAAIHTGPVDTGGAGLRCYNAAKAAVTQWTKTPATEVGPHGIRVNAVAPGCIRTPMTDRRDRAAQARCGAAMTRTTPLGRAGEPDDVAHAVLYLASDASAFMAGQILRPNGSVAMPW
ncbi:hypothetical protein C3492_40295 [Streptomyces sp. Ru62]|nr:hypothetical protein C3492_40295 [Streptomyces sp. Ru62]